MSTENPQQPPAQQLTADAIAAAVKAALPAPQQQQQQIDPARLDQMLNRFNYGAELDAIMTNPQSTAEQRIGAWNQIIRGIITEATTISRFQGEHLGQLIMEHFEEPISFARDYGQKQLFESLYESAPGLKAFDGVNRELVATLSKDPNFPRTNAERVTFLRDRLANVIKQSAPSFDPVKGFEAGVVTSGGAPNTGASNPPAGFAGIPSASSPPPATGNPRVPAGSSGGAGGGTGNPLGAPTQPPANNGGGPTPDKPWGF